MATYYAKNYSSDLAIGTGHYVLSPNLDNTYDNAAVSVAIPASSNVVYNFYTPAGLPSNVGAWGSMTGAGTVNITTAATSTNVSIAVSRVNSAGTVQVQGTYGATVATTATGSKAVTSASTAFGTGVAGDRILYQVKFTNTSTSAKTIGFGLSDGIHDLVISISEYVGVNPATISNLSAYDSDNITAISEYTTSGATNVNVDFDVNPYVEDESTVLTAPALENRIGALTGTSTQTIPDVWYNSDWPQGMRSSPIVWDSTQKRFLMFSGALGNTATENNQLWELRLSSGKGKWRQLQPTGTYPAIRYMGGLSFDALNNQLVVVFGYTTTDTNTLYYCSFSSSADGVWTSRTPSGTAPAARSNIVDSVMTDYTNNCCYVFGGWGASYYNGIYKLTFSTGTPGGTWSTVVADGATGAPAARRNATAKLDTQNNRILVTMGNAAGTTNENDLWQYSLSTPGWTQLSPTGTLPGVRELQVGSYDPVNHKMFIYGGYTSAVANNYNEMWVLDTSTTNCSWTNVTPSATDTGQFPLGKEGSSAAYDPDDKVHIIWGGVDTSNDNGNHQVQLVDLSETTPYLYGLSMNSFMRPMDAASFTYNTDRQEGVVAGGFSQIQDNATYATLGGHVGDVFAYNYTNNRWRVATKGIKTFPWREGCMTVYDSVGKRVLIFGGLWGNGAVAFGPFNEIWEAKANANGDYILRKMAPTGSRPPFRWLGAAAFDAVNNRVIITTGSNGGTVNYNDVWQLSLTSGDGAWTQITPTGTAPTAVWQPGYAYDSTNHKLYIVGGATSTGDTTYTNAVYSLDLTTNNAAAWATLAVAPASYRGWSCAIDAASGYMFAFGGYNGTSVFNAGYYYNISANSWSASFTPATVPGARRSAAAWYDTTNRCFILTHGRVPSGSWWGDTWKLVPNYTTPASSVYTNLAPAHALKISIPATGLTNPAPYTAQGWVTVEGVVSTKTAGSVPTYILGMPAYTMGGLSAIPTDRTPPTTTYTSTQITDVDTVNNSTDVTTTNSTTYQMHWFTTTTTTPSTNFNVTWTGKASKAGSTSTITMQMWNFNTSAWVTLTTNTTVAANTSFTLTGSVTTNPAFYWDSNNVGYVRVYQ